MLELILYLIGSIVAVSVLFVLISLFAVVVSFTVIFF